MIVSLNLSTGGKRKEVETSEVRSSAPVMRAGLGLAAERNGSPTLAMLDIYMVIFTRVDSKCCLITCAG